MSGWWHGVQWDVNMCVCGGRGEQLFSRNEIGQESRIASFKVRWVGRGSKLLVVNRNMVQGPRHDVQSKLKIRQKGYQTADNEPQNVVAKQFRIGGLGKEREREREREREGERERERERESGKKREVVFESHNLV
jgi:hypothetical protein